ncbi:ABC transporter permease [Pseudonocardia ailaonensis]|uniref:ABC transporter permease n=1 Tax=Pseudonocardia ailaonensis TaxID=367279 RepID=A0ABN2NN64_9PSEU
MTLDYRAEPTTAAPPVVDVPPVAARTRRRFRVPRPVRRLAGPVLVLAAWALVCATGLVGPQVLPAPWSVLGAGWDLAVSGKLWFHLSASLERVGLGLVLGVVLGTALAVASGFARVGEDLIDSTVQLFKSVPHVALVPLLIVWFGINQEPRIILITAGVFVPVYINTFSAIRGVDRDLVEAAKAFGATRRMLVTQVVLPGALPGFLVGLRFALAAAWLSLVFAETINTNQGLGYLMSLAQTLLQTDVMMFTILTYAVIGLLSYALVKGLEHRLLRWRNGYEGA